jgi:phage repressor protein C with HTH and peptisase S24 domain
MDVGERLKEFLKYLDISQGKFEANVKLANGYVNNLKDNIRSNTLAKISAVYPELNTAWLLTGEGEMLLNNESSQNMPPDMIPLLPISAQAGRLNDFIVSVKDKDCERIISPIRGIDFAITVSGDSMLPEYPNGSQVLIKKINEKAFIEWGRVYVLDTCNGVVVKRVFPSEKEGHVKCVSTNTEYPSFDVESNDIYGIYRVMLCMSTK